MRIVEISNVKSFSSTRFLMGSSLFLFLSIFVHVILFVIVLTPFKEVGAINLRGCCSRDEVFDFDNSMETGGMCVYKNDEEDDDDELKIVSPKCEGVLAIVDSDINSSFISVNVDGKMEINSEYSSLMRRKNDNDDEEVCLDIEASLDKLLVLRSCKDVEYCNENLCFRKCCPENEIYVFVADEIVCGKTDDKNFQTLAQWHVEFRDVQIDLMNNERTVNGTEKESYQVLNASDYGLLVGLPPDCPYNRWPEAITDGNWRIDSNGVFYYRIGDSYYDQRNSCIEIWADPKIDNVTKFHTFACHDNDGEEPRDVRIRRYTKATLMLISCAFLLATLLVYGCLTALQNLHGKTVMAYVGSLFFGYLGTAALSLNFIKQYEDERDKEKHNSSRILCKFLGYATLFFLLSVFAWLNVICYDIWDKFRSLRNSGRSLSDRREAKIRFIYYCIFAWGFGLIVTVAAYLSDRFQFLPDYLLPGFGSQRCWFVAVDSQKQKSYSEVFFFFGPVSLQLLFNVILYVLTARRCSLVKNEIASRVRADRSDTADRDRQFESDRTKMILSVKLFVVMGISWIFEILSVLTNFYISEPSDWIPWLFLLSDAVNCLQGLLIFLLFVYKDHVITALRKRFLRSGSYFSSSFRTWTNRREIVNKDPLKRAARSRSTITTTSNSALSSNSVVGDSPL